MSALAVQSQPGLVSLRQLLAGLVSNDLLAQVPEIFITGITVDSRAVLPDAAFIAVPGLHRHGIDFVTQAVARGASVVLWQPLLDHTLKNLPNVFMLAVPQLSTLLGRLADRFYAQPSAALRIAAVTGTNGKTTTAYLLAGAAQSCGLAAGYTGTVGYGRVDALRPSTHTTPDVLSVHGQLSELRAAGAAVVGMEVSSHALHQARIDAVRIDTAVFTNLSRDHLDYHGDMQAYGAAKARLFQVPGLRHQVINADDTFGLELLRTHANAALTTAYSCRADATAIAGARLLRAEVQLHSAGLQLQIDGDYGRATLRTALLGRFNAENLLAALAVLLGWDVSLRDAVQALQGVSAPPGRMQLLEGAGRRVIVDYAHTPDALQQALSMLKQHTAGRLWCVFGCGGERDAGKRPLMGAVAARLADEVILTDDNPRSEDPAQIIAAIQVGMVGMGNMSVRIQRDRARAIAEAVQQAQHGDAVLIAGKGHEDYQLIGAQRQHFSDAEVVRACLEALA